MTNDEIDKLEVGFELDALVAEKIFNDTPPRGYGVPDYSTDIAAAWEVVEKMASKGFDAEVMSLSSGLPSVDDNHRCYCEFQVPWRIGFNRLRAFAPTVPLAICRAALKAVLA